MGTRHLIIVYHEGKYKLAQYGYPEGQGVVVLGFVSDPDNLARLTANLDKLYNPSEAEFDAIYARLEHFNGEINDRMRTLRAQGGSVEVLMEIQRHGMQFVCPSISRGTSAGILGMIANAEAPLPVADDLAFVAESKLCEWMYVVDLDKGTLEVYAGAWDGPGEQTRFSELECVKIREGKGPLLKGSWAFAELVNLSGYAFVQALSGDREEEEQSGPGSHK